MPTLTITKNYAANTVLTEAQIDAQNDSITTFINTTKLDSDNLQTNGVNANSLASNSVTTVKLNASAVTTAKLSDNNVTTIKLAKNIGNTQATQVSPSGTTQTLDWDNGNIQQLDLGSASGDVTLTLSNPTTGATYRVLILQGATARDVVWPAAVKWPGDLDPVLSNTDTDTDALELYFDGTNYYGSIPADIIRSEFRVHTGNGHGSTNTVIRRFTTTEENIGTAITFADTAADGSTFTLNEDGVYTASYTDVVGAGTPNMGISRNSSQLTTGIPTITVTDRLSIAKLSDPNVVNLSVTFIAAATDVIRAHTDGSANFTNSDDNVYFHIIKVSN